VKGVVLAGGIGSRLTPLTEITASSVRLVSEYCADRVLRQPLYAGLRDGEVDRITDAVRSFFGG
jgi:dTDP-glucose pyrophosphorylase